MHKKTADRDSEWKVQFSAATWTCYIKCKTVYIKIYNWIAWFSWDSTAFL